MSYHWDDWTFTRSADGQIPKGKYPWWIDRRHVEFIYDISLKCGFRRVLEIGVHHGASTTALVQAINDGATFDLHTCDPEETKVFHQVIAKCRLPVIHHRTCSLNVIPILDWDMVVVDGDHSLWHVTQELGLLFAGRVPTILGHDVRMANWMNDKYAGSSMMADVLKAHKGFRTWIDCENRDGEWTRRGFLAATSDDKVAAVIGEAWQERVLR